MKSQVLKRRLAILFLFGLAWTLTACTLPGRANRGLANPSYHGPTATSTPILTATPDPSPTATPKALSKADPEQAKRLTENGNALFLKSDLAGAEAAFIDAIAADAHDLQAYNGLTNVYLYLPQDWQQALKTAQVAIVLAPNDINTQTYLALAQQNAHHFEDARRTILAATKLAPGNARGQATLASVLGNFYEFDAAYKAAKLAVQLDDQNASAWATLGSIAYSQEQWNEAGAAYAKAAQLQPTFFAWPLLLARHTLNVTGDGQQVLTLLQPARQLQPNHPWVLALMADAALEKNDWKTAEVACQKMLAANQPTTPYAEGYSCMVSVLIGQERYNDAEAYQVLAEQIASPEQWNVATLRMRLYNERDECPKALALAQKWLVEHPYSVLAMRMVGVSYLCDEQFDQAIAAFKQALAKTPRSVADARLLANAYARAGKAFEAKAVLNQVSSFAAQDPIYYRGLYEVALLLDEHEAALQAAQRWQVLRPYSSDAKVSVALVQLLKGDIEAAQNAAQSALDNGATGAILYAVLGETYNRQANFEQAEYYLLQSLALADNNFLAHSFIFSLYLAHGDCDQAAIHAHWLQANTKDVKRVAQIQDLLDHCQPSDAQTMPGAPTLLDDREGLRVAQTVLNQAGVTIHDVHLAEDAHLRTLLIAYTSDLDPTSRAFTEQERNIALALARLLTQMVSQPDGLVLLSGAGATPQNIIYIATPAALIWSRGELTDDEFVKIWVRRRINGLKEQGNPM